MQLGCNARHAIPSGYRAAMHTVRHKKKRVARFRRVKVQLEAVERALTEECAARRAPVSRQRERGVELVVLLTAEMMGVEVVVGYATHSMALLADGWHMATHVGALGLVAIAMVVESVERLLHPLSLSRRVELVASGPARIYGIARKGRIAVGADADLAFVDRKTHGQRSYPRLRKTRNSVACAPQDPARYGCGSSSRRSSPRSLTLLQLCCMC
jgi:hypothetical protein